jgi:hypothetical protein
MNLAGLMSDLKDTYNNPQATTVQKITVVLSGITATVSAMESFVGAYGSKLPIGFNVIAFQTNLAKIAPAVEQMAEAFNNGTPADKATATLGLISTTAGVVGSVPGLPFGISAPANLLSIIGTLGGDAVNANKDQINAFISQISILSTITPPADTGVGAVTSDLFGQDNHNVGRITVVGNTITTEFSSTDVGKVDTKIVQTFTDPNHETLTSESTTSYNLTSGLNNVSTIHYNPTDPNGQCTFDSKTVNAESGLVTQGISGTEDNGVTHFDPGTTPVDPGTTPVDPGTTPVDPGTTPVDPGTTPVDPGTTPVDPGTTPVDPGTTPVDPGTTPVDPGTTPVDPGTTPADPGTTPGDPGTTPGDPGTTPGDPGTTTGDPGTTPGDPGTTTGDPGTTTGDPGTTTGDPGASGGDPGASGGDPGAGGGDPGASGGDPGAGGGDSGAGGFARSIPSLNNGKVSAKGLSVVQSDSVTNYTNGGPGSIVGHPPIVPQSTANLAAQTNVNQLIQAMASLAPTHAALTSLAAANDATIKPPLLAVAH